MPRSTQPSPSAQFSALVSRFPPGTVALVEKCMPKLRRALPGANQIVYDYAKSVVVSFSMSERGYEAIVAMAISAAGVQLYFDKSIPDPQGLLGGSGTKVRSVTVESASALDRGDIHALIEAAKKHSGATIARTGANPMIIKESSKKPKAKKVAKTPKRAPKKAPKKAARA